MKYILLSVAILSLSACATTHPGKMGQSLRNSLIPLKISAEKAEQKENEAFQLVDVTIENTSPIWLKINTVRVVIDNPGETKLSVVMGRDLKDWALAMQARLKQESYNKNMLMTGIAAAGAVATAYGIAENNKAATIVGATSLVGAGAWAATEHVKSNKQKATTSETVPDNHLYQSFSIPGNMFTRKWVLLNKPASSTIDKIILDVETVEGKKDTYEIAL